MSLRRRLKVLEAHARDAEAQPSRKPDNYPTHAVAIGQLDGLIRRLDEQVHKLAEVPESYVDGYDDARYGMEPLEEHEARVHALMAALDERNEAWRREHRPDLAGVPNEIDAHIAKVEAEIALLEGEGGLVDANMLRNQAGRRAVHVARSKSIRALLGSQPGEPGEAPQGAISRR